MKSIIFLAIMSILTSLGAAEPLSSKDKIYLTQNEIQIDGNGILVFVQNNWIQTSSIHSDASGLYVDEFGAWLCDRCGQWTTGWFVCEHCGNPK